MDPRVGWHPNELLSNAYSTWTNVWMIAQMNCTNPVASLHSQTCNVNTNNNVNNTNKTENSNKSDDLNSAANNSYSKFKSLKRNKYL